MRGIETIQVMGSDKTAVARGATPRFWAVEPLLFKSRRLAFAPRSAEWGTALLAAMVGQIPTSQDISRI